MTNRTDRLKVALVGCGKFADAHVEEILKQPGADLVAVCDSEPLMSEQLAIRYGVPKTYDDLERMLETELPDVLHIVTPPQTHLNIAEKAMNAGCHVFVEKPLAARFDDAERMLSCAERTGRKLTTGWRFLFDPPTLVMRRLIDEGVIGDPVHIESFYGYDLQGPFGNVFRADKEHWVHRLPGKLFQNNIDHLLNKYPEFMGDRPLVIADAYSRAGDDTLEDELRIMLRSGPVTGSVTFSAHIRPMAHTATIRGTKQTMHIDFIARTVTLAAGARMPGAIGRLLPAFGQGWSYWQEGARNIFRFAKSEYHYFAGLNTLIARFYESIVKDTPPPLSYRDMRWVNTVMEQVFNQISATQACRS